MALLFDLLLTGIIHTRPAACLPVTNTMKASTGHTVGWVSDPNGRGTLSLFTSCALTMGLCIWSALHLNIPPRDQGKLKFWRGNTKWILVGLFGPELVVFSAWHQFNSARALQAIVPEAAESRKRNSAVKGKKDTAAGVGSLRYPENAGTDLKQKSKARRTSISPTSQSTWSMVHGFYATMGGFVFELDSSKTPILSSPISEPQRLTVTPCGVALLARCGLLPEISRKEIWDKSKADGLAKAIVCLQAAWMIVQVLGRVAGRLPVTLLEVNTIGHVLCAFTIYVLWWHKPRLIQEPTVLRGEWVQPLVAYMWMSSRISDSTKESLWPGFASQRTPEIAGLTFYPCLHSHAEVAAHSEQPVLTSSNLQPKPEGMDGRIESIVPVLAKDNSQEKLGSATLHCALKPGFGYLGPTVQAESKAGEAQTQRNPAQNDNTPENWRLALDAMEMFPAIWEQACPDSTAAWQRCFQLSGEELVTKRAKNWAAEGLLRSIGGWVMGMMLWFASMAFGAVHAAAWHSQFPSYLEAQLWRSSSLYITASGFLWLCINMIAGLFPSFNAFWEGLLARHGGQVTYVILGFACTVCGLAYAFARVYLVVEAVISLRCLPANAYDTPDWSQLIPHL